MTRLIRELKVPGVVLFIMVTVWSVGYSDDLDRRLRGYHLPAPPALRAQFDQDDTSAEPAPSTFVGAADAIEGIDDD